jgi:hypothetical protein
MGFVQLYLKCGQCACGCWTFGVVGNVRLLVELLELDELC